MHQSPRILPVYTMITQQNCRLLNNALLNYRSPPGQVLLRFVRCERCGGGEGGSRVQPFWDLKHGESSTSPYEGDQSELLMCYTSRDITTSGWAGAGETHGGHICGASDS